MRGARGRVGARVDGRGGRPRGRRADPDDPAAIAAAIREAHARRDALVARGLLHAAQFTWRASGEMFLAGYEEAAAR